MPTVNWKTKNHITFKLRGVIIHIRSNWHSNFEVERSIVKITLGRKGISCRSVVPHLSTKRLCICLSVCEHFYKVFRSNYGSILRSFRDMTTEGKWTDDGPALASIAYLALGGPATNDSISKTAQYRNMFTANHWQKVLYALSINTFTDLLSLILTVWGAILIKISRYDNEPLHC